MTQRAQEWWQLIDSLKKETIAEAVVRHHRHCGSHQEMIMVVLFPFKNCRLATEAEG
jgi:hypothetical protein